ncbi:MAG TPA: sugar nucleotide-binding protein [Azospirillaceae bacterium]|nr:sugar nucleotide-binding protein [Azospirillaceae bacterium]
MTTNAPCRLLLVGGDGFVGTALRMLLPSHGFEVLATSRRPGAPLHLDLLHPDAFEIPANVDAALLCAAVSQPVVCEADPDGSRRINVDGPAHLLPRLAAAGIRTLVLSSDKVFDGTRPMRRRDEPVCPVIPYGRQKAEMEQVALAAGAAVLRLSRVVSADMALLHGWVADLADGRAIRPFSDMRLAPVDVARVARLAAAILGSWDHGGGIFQASGAADITYAEMALALAAWTGADPALVLPQPAPPAVAGSVLSRHTTLDMRREVELFGIGHPTLDDLRPLFTVADDVS